MKNKLVLFFICFIIWMLLGFSYKDWQHVVIGIGVSFMVAALSGDLFTTRPALFLKPKRYLWFFAYLFFFAWECLKANVDMARRLVSINIPLSPGIIKIKTSLKTEIALMYLANTLTLTKGAIAVDVDNENDFLYLHWIDLKNTDKQEIINFVQKIERILGKIFE